MTQEEIDRILAGYEEMNKALRESLELRNISPASRQEETPPVGVEPQVDPVVLQQSVETIEQFGESTEGLEENDIVAFALELQAGFEREQRLAWVAQILPIQTLDDLDFGALYDRIKQRGGAPAQLASIRNKAPDESIEEFEQRVVEEFLGQGNNLLSRTVLESWAAQSGMLERQTKIETPHGDVYSWQIDEIAQTSPSLIGFEIDLIGLAREHGIDPAAAASLYENALELGQIDGFLDTRPAQVVNRRGRGGSGEAESLIDTKAEGDLFEEYKAGMGLYASDAIFAQIHAIDPDLAAKLWDPDSAYTTVSRDEWVKVQDIVTRMNPNVSGWRNTTAAWMEKGWEGNAGDGGDGGGVVINKGQVRESLRQLAQNWNLGNISDAELESLVGGFVSESIARVRRQAPHPSDIIREVEAGGGNEITDTPSAQEFLRQTDRYKDLYGRKSAGESEEEYAFRFQSAAQGFLGDIGSNMGFEQAGMRTGDVQTTIGQAAVSPESAGSSTFLGRMARTAEVVRGMT